MSHACKSFYMEGKDNRKFEQFFSDRHVVKEDLMTFDIDGIPSLLYVIIIIIIIIII